jgi:hypothetical protein
MIGRQKRLLSLIEQATGKTAYIGNFTEEGDDVAGDEHGPDVSIGDCLGHPSLWSPRGDRSRNALRWNDR